MFFSIAAFSMNLTVVVSPEDLDYLSIYKSYRTSQGWNITVIEYNGENPQELRKEINSTYPQAVLIFGPFSKIPGFEVFPIPENHYSINTDFYYSDLLSRPDKDGDGYPGEYAQDEVSFPLLPVGRVPLEGEEIKDWTRRLIFFENYKEGTAKGSVLLLGAMLFYENEDGENYPVDDGGEYLDYIYSSFFNETTPIKVYEKEGLVTYPGTADYSLSEPFWEKLSMRNIKFANWSAHGSSDGIWRKIWRVDKGDGIANFNEMEWVNILPLSYFQLPDNIFMPPWWAFVAFSNSCSSYEESHSFVPEMLQRSAVAIVASTGIVYDISYWKDENSGGSSSINYFFWKYFLQDNLTAGEALAKAKEYYYHNLFKYCDFYLGESPTVNQLNLMGFHLFGDPLTSLNVVANDTFAPLIDDISPPFLTSPNVKLVIFDESGLNSTSIMVKDSEGNLIDTKTSESKIDESIVLYTVSIPAETYGKITVSVNTEDNAGNTGVKSFSHTIFFGEKETPRVFIWPNPFKDELKIYVSCPEEVNYTIYSAAGFPVLKGSLKGFTKIKPVFQPGLYFLKIDLPESPFVSKIVKLR